MGGSASVTVDGRETDEVVQTRTKGKALFRDIGNKIRVAKALSAPTRSPLKTSSRKDRYSYDAKEDCQYTDAPGIRPPKSGSPEGGISKSVGSSRPTSNFMQPTTTSKLKQQEKIEYTLSSPAKRKNSQRSMTKTHPGNPRGSRSVSQVSSNPDTVPPLAPVIPMCTICDMTFSSDWRYKNHVKFSSLHQKMLNKAVKAAVKADVNMRGSPLRKPHDAPSEWHLLFRGNQFFWRTKHSFEVLIWVNEKDNVVLISPYHPDSNTESERIFLRWDALNDQIGADTIRKQVHDSLKTLPSHLQISHVDRRVEEKITNRIVTLIHDNLEVVTSESDEVLARWKSCTTGKNKNQDLLVENPPEMQLPEVLRDVPESTNTDKLKMKRRSTEMDFTKSTEEVRFNVTTALHHVSMAAEILDEMQSHGGTHEKDTISRQVLQNQTIHQEAQIKALEKKLARQRQRLQTAVDKSPAELNEALEGALKLLDTVKKRDIAYSKAFAKPPTILSEIMALALLMMGKKDTGWDAARHVMGGTLQASFLSMVRSLDLTLLPASKAKAVQAFVSSHPQCFDSNQLKKGGLLAEALGVFLLAKFEIFLGSKAEVEASVTDSERELEGMKAELYKATAELKQIKQARHQRNHSFVIPESQQQRQVVPGRRLKSAVQGVMFLMRCDSLDNNQKQVVNSSFHSRRRSIA